MRRILLWSKTLLSAIAPIAYRLLEYCLQLALNLTYKFWMLLIKKKIKIYFSYFSRVKTNIQNQVFWLKLFGYILYDMQCFKNLFSYGKNKEWKQKSKRQWYSYFKTITLLTSTSEKDHFLPPHLSQKPCRNPNFHIIYTKRITEMHITTRWRFGTVISQKWHF